MTTGAARSRDAAGRPRNSRPRDGLGRPLPPGSAGVERVPDDLAVAPLEGLRLAQELLDAGRPFHAHEVLEAVWKAAPADERRFWRALAQLAVGLTHRARGNHAGAVALLRRAADGLAPYAEHPPYGVPVAELAAGARRLADDPGADPAATLPRLC